MKSRASVLSTTLVVGALLVPLTFSKVNAQSSPANSAPDNSVQNERDRNHATLTPMDQSSKPADIDMSSRIRRALVKDDNLSTEAGTRRGDSLRLTAPSRCAVQSRPTRRKPPSSLRPPNSQAVRRCATNWKLRRISAVWPRKHS